MAVREVETWHEEIARQMRREMLKLIKSQEVQLQSSLLAASNYAQNLVSLLPGEDAPEATRRAMYQQQRGALTQVISDLWGDDGVAGIVKNDVRKATDLAVRGNQSILATLLKVMPPGEADVLARSFYASANNSWRNVQSRIINSVDLSSKIYNAEALSSGFIDRIVNEGLALGQSADEIAQSVVGFINPKTPGGASYAANRLGRTELSNAFHETARQTYRDSRYVEGAKWNLSGSHGQPDECDEWDGEIFGPDEVPDLPHPQCLCYTTAVTPSPDEFVDNLLSGSYDDMLTDQGVAAAGAVEVAAPQALEGLDLGRITDPGTPIGPVQKKLLGRQFRKDMPDSASFMRAMSEGDLGTLERMMPGLRDSKVWREQAERAMRDSRSEISRLTAQSLEQRDLPDSFVAWRPKNPASTIGYDDADFVRVRLGAPEDMDFWEPVFVHRRDVLFDENAFIDSMRTENGLIVRPQGITALDESDLSKLDDYVKHNDFNRQVHPFERPKPTPRRRITKREEAPKPKPIEPVEPDIGLIKHQPNDPVTYQAALDYSKARIRAMDGYLSEEYGFTSHWTGDVFPETYKASRYGGTTIATKQYECPISINIDYFAKQMTWDPTLAFSTELKRAHFELHELLHGVSDSGSDLYHMMGGWEEVVVEGAAQGIRNEVIEGALGHVLDDRQLRFLSGITTSYQDGVHSLDVIADAVGMPKRDFYLDLLRENIDQRPVRVRRLVKDAVDAGVLDWEDANILIRNMEEEIGNLSKANVQRVEVFEEFVDAEVLSQEERVRMFDQAIDKAERKEAAYAANPPTPEELETYREQVEKAERAGGEYRGSGYDRAASRANLNNEFASQGFGREMTDAEKKAYGLHPKKLNQLPGESDAAFAARKAVATQEFEVRRMHGYTPEEAERLEIEFSDAFTHCVWCGVRLTPDNISRDKIIGGARGGRYTLDNLLPSCNHCNKVTNFLHKGGAGADQMAVVSALRAKREELLAELHGFSKKEARRALEEALS